MSFLFHVGSPITDVTFLIHAPGENTAQAVVLESAGSQSTFAAEGIKYVYRSAMLPDGRVVIPCFDSAAGAAVQVYCYEAGSTTVVDWQYEILGSSLAYYSDVCVLTNGNIVVMWCDYIDYRAYFVILDSDGGLVQGETHCDPYEEYDANYEVPNHVIALADGGFYCYWMLDDTFPAGSVWNANGTQRTDYYYYDDTIESSAPIEMPTGGIGQYAGYLVISQSATTDGIAVVNPNDMTDWTNIISGEMSTNPEWIYMASPPAWNDRVVVVWTEGTTTYYMIITDDGDTDGWITLSANLVVNDLVQLPDGTLLILYNDGASEYGQSYYILDTSDEDALSILSGPHTAFTGLSTNPDPNCHGCAGSV